MRAEKLDELDSIRERSARLGNERSAEFYAIRIHAYRFVQAMLALAEGDEPVLIYSTNFHDSYINYLDAAGRESRAPAKAFSDAPTGPVKFKTKFSPQKCAPSSDAESPRSRKAAKCHEAIDRKYDALFDAAERKRDSARTVGGVRAAESELARLREAEGNARRTQCGAADEALRSEMEDAFNEIVDRYRGGDPPAASRGQIKVLQTAG